MIWVGGRIVEDGDLKVSVLDRTFEHGLGLFETLRTWHGHVPLLDRHLARMQNSARTLGLSLDPKDLPDAPAVASLIEAEALQGDLMLRITASGGTASGKSIVWMRTAPLPFSGKATGLHVIPTETSYSDPLARHKTLNYWSRRLAYEHAIATGADEALRISPDGRAWSGSRTNLFVVREETLLTPGLQGPIVPGILRGVVLERAQHLDIEVREVDLSTDALRTSSEMFLTNAVRGILPVASFDGRVHDSPGPITNRLRSEVSRWLHRGGIE